MRWFSTFELEGMGLEKLDIAYVFNKLYGKYKPPIYTTTKYTFEKDLVNPSIRRWEKAKKLAVEEEKTYVCNTHSINKVVNTIEKYSR